MTGRPEPQASVDTSPEPVVWLLGKAQAGKTSIVAEMTGDTTAEVGNGFEPKTKTARVYPFPPDQPLLRFLDTRGLADVEEYDPRPDLDAAARLSHVIVAVVRVEDLAIDEIVATVREARAAHPQWPVVIAQTCLHHLYDRRAGHLLPYPFEGSDQDADLPGLSGPLRRALVAQRALFADLPGRGPVFFVPLDFTPPEAGLPPGDYGADRLFLVLEQVLLDVMTRIAEKRRGKIEKVLRTKVILPWAFAAAAANAVPVPVLGGLGSASLQAVMVNAIARRFGFTGKVEVWREFLSALGAGFALGFGGGWLAQQVLKLGIGWGSAAVAAWTFAVTWAIGETALYYFRERARDKTPSQQAMRAHYKAAFAEAQAFYKRSKTPPPASGDAA